MLFHVGKKLKWLGVLILFMPTLVFSKPDITITPGYNAIFSVLGPMGHGAYVDVDFGINPHVSIVTLFDAFYSLDDIITNKTYLKASVGARVFLVPQYFFLDILGNIDLAIGSRRVTLSWFDYKETSRFTGHWGGTLAIGGIISFTDTLGLQLSVYTGMHIPFPARSINEFLSSFYWNYGLRAGLTIKI